MKRLSLFLLVICILAGLRAQNPTEVSVYRPKVLTAKLISSKDLTNISADKGWGQNDGNTGKFWDVYSDRSENITYNGPSLTSGKKGELGMGEPVRIAEIKNNMAHVYQEAQNPIHPKILTPTWKGWVPMDNLLLWDTCPVDDKGIYQKALIVVNLGKTKKENMQDILAIYSHPEKNIKRGQAVSNINFKFIMKSVKTHQKTRYLLATQYKVQLDGNGFYGWVDEQSYVAWNQRSCLEPNFRQESVIRFQNKKETLSVYESSDLKKPVTSPFNYGEIQNKDYKKPAEKYRMSKGSLRYPILDKDDQANDNTYRCNVFANPVNGSITDAAQYNEDLNRQQTSAVKNVESVNLIIAIDGTSSMGNYYPAVRQAIKEGYSYYDNRNFDVKIGLVIYRDYADGEFVTEYLSLRSHTDPSIDKFLSQGGLGGYGIKSSPKDKTYEEALYAGLMVATDKQKMGFGDKESNLLLVVGDCGNDQKDNKFSQSDIVNRLVDNKFQVISFQVRRKNEIPFNLYGTQMRDLIKANIQHQIDKLNQRAQVDKKLVVDFKKTKDGFELGNLSLNYYIGSLLQPINGLDMSAEILANYIKDKLGQYSDAIQRQRQAIQSPLSLGGNTRDSTEQRLERAFIEERVGKEYVDAIIKSNSILSTEGYTPKKDPAGYDYWSTVLYISAEELTKLLDDLRPLDKAARASSYDNRKPYVTAVKGLIRSMLPDEYKDEERMEKMTTEQVMAQIYGLNASTATLNGRTLQEIQDPKIVDNGEYASIINDFSEKFANLVRIKNGDFDFKLQVNETTYYWIPTDQLP